MTYNDAMLTLSGAAQDAIDAADNEDGAPVDALKLIARDIDSIIAYGSTWAEVQDAKALYEGAKQAGLPGGKETP